MPLMCRKGIVLARADHWSGDEGESLEVTAVPKLPVSLRLFWLLWVGRAPDLVLLPAEEAFPKLIPASALACAGGVQSGLALAMCDWDSVFGSLAWWPPGSLLLPSFPNPCCCGHATPTALTTETALALC